MLIANIRIKYSFISEPFFISKFEQSAAKNDSRTSIGFIVTIENAITDTKNTIKLKGCNSENFISLPQQGPFQDRMYTAILHNRHFSKGNHCNQHGQIHHLHCTSSRINHHMKIHKYN